MSERVLYIVVKLAELFIGGLAVMLAVVWLIAVAQGRSCALQCRAVVVIWLALVGSFIAGTVAAIVLAQDFSDRIIVFSVVMLGIFILFLMRSDALDKLR